MATPNAHAPLGQGGRFAALENKLAGRPGVNDPGALAAAIGRRKYGAQRFGQMGAQGRHAMGDAGGDLQSLLAQLGPMLGGNPMGGGSPMAAGAPGGLRAVPPNLGSFGDLVRLRTLYRSPQANPNGRMPQPIRVPGEIGSLEGGPMRPRAGY